MTPSILADQLPLVALVDAIPRGPDLLDMLSTLTNPFLIELVQRFDTRSPTSEFRALDEDLRHWIVLIQEPEIRGRMYWLYRRLFHNIATIIMARVVTTERYIDLRQFVEGLPRVLELSGKFMYDPKDLGSLQRLAIVMAAVAHQKQQVYNLPDSHISDTTDRSPATTLKVKCSLAEVMRKLDLPRGAEFLEQTLTCPGPEQDG
ncbi:hypothetical protein H4R33_004153, partial [Dimargaris cristalligena]